MLCQQSFAEVCVSWSKLSKILSKNGPFSNCFIQERNEGIDPSLENTEKTRYIYNNILCHSIKFLLTSAFLGVLQYFPYEVMATSYSQTFFPKLGTSKLNLLVSFMKNGSQELILLKKEFGSDFSILWLHFAFPLSHR